MNEQSSARHMTQETVWLYEAPTVLRIKLAMVGANLGVLLLTEFFNTGRTYITIGGSYVFFRAITQRILPLKQKPP